MSELFVREAELDEIERIAPLKQQLTDAHAAGEPGRFDPEPDFSAFVSYVVNKDMHLFVVEKDEKWVAYALVRYVHSAPNVYMMERKFVHVEEVCVDKDCKRMGIGRILMEHIRQDARQKGYSHIQLDVWSFNEGAMQFYESLGMRTVRSLMEMSTD